MTAFMAQINAGSDFFTKGLSQVTNNHATVLQASQFPLHKTLANHTRSAPKAQDCQIVYSCPSLPPCTPVQGTILEPDFLLGRPCIVNEATQAQSPRTHARPRFSVHLLTMVRWLIFAVQRIVKTLSQGAPDGGQHTFSTRTIRKIFKRS